MNVKTLLLTGRKVKDKAGKSLSLPGCELLAGPLPVPGAADADHPDQQHQHDHEEDGARDPARDVRELGLLLALGAGEGSAALAVRLAVLVQQTGPAVAAVALALVAAALALGPLLGAPVPPPPVAAEAVLALAARLVLALEEHAARVTVAHLAPVLLAGVGALRLVDGAGAARAGVGRAVVAGGLLAPGLVLAHGAQPALVVHGAERGARGADRDVAVLDAPAGGAAGGAVWRALLAAAVPALGAVAAHGTHLALPRHAQLEAVLAVGPTLLGGGGLLGARGEAHPAQLAAEPPLLGLVAAEAAVSAEAGDLVVVGARAAPLLAVRGGGGALGLRHTVHGAVDAGALGARALGKVRVVEAARAFGADLLGLVEVGAGGAGHALVVHHHLAALALEAGVEDDGAGVEQGAGQRVVHSLHNTTSIIYSPSTNDDAISGNYCEQK